MSFKKIFPHVFVIFCFICLVALGTWQLSRREWKNELLQTINTRSAAEPISPAEFTNIDNDEFKLIKIRGHFLNDKEVLLLNRTYNGKAGQYVLTPLDTGKEIILVNRGWIPTDKEYVRPIEEVEVKGIIRGTQKLNFIGKHVILDNEPAHKMWFWLDLPRVYESMGLTPLGYYIDTIRPNRKISYPLALDGKIQLYNEHLQYAITWYSLSIVLLLVYYFRFHRNGNSKSSKGKTVQEVQR